MTNKKNIDETSLGFKIKKLRKELHYFQEELANKLNDYYLDQKKKKKLNKNIKFTQVDISQLETNSSISQFKTMLIITYFYDIHNVNPEYFFIKNKKNKTHNFNQKILKNINDRIDKYTIDNKKLIFNLKKDLLNIVKNLK